MSAVRASRCSIRGLAAPARCRDKHLRSGSFRDARLPSGWAPRQTSHSSGIVLTPISAVYVDAPSSSSNRPSVSLTHAGNELTVQGRVRLHSPALTVYELLTAYDKGSSVYRDVVESRLVRDDGDSKVVVQVCQWKFLTFSGTFSTQLRVVEAPDQLSVSFSLLDSALLKSFCGSWHLTPSEGSNECSVQYVLTLEPHMHMPGPIRAAVGSALSLQAKLLLEDLSVAVRKHCSSSQPAAVL